MRNVFYTGILTLSVLIIYTLTSCGAEMRRVNVNEFSKLYEGEYWYSDYWKYEGEVNGQYILRRYTKGTLSVSEKKEAIYIPVNEMTSDFLKAKQKPLKYINQEDLDGVKPR